MPIAEARRQKKRRLTPEQQVQARRARRFRFFAAAAGLLIVSLGWSAIARGNEGWVNFRHEFVWAIAVAIAGLSVFLVAVTPSSMLARLVGLQEKKTVDRYTPSR